MSMPNCIDTILLARAAKTNIMKIEMANQIEKRNEIQCDGINMMIHLYRRKLFGSFGSTWCVSQISQTDERIPSRTASIPDRMN